MSLDYRNALGYYLTMKQIVLILLALSCTACGRAPVALSATAHMTAETAETMSAPVAAVTSAQSAKITACGVALKAFDGQVTNLSTGEVVANGSYSSGGYFMPNGFFVPVCTYTVLDGNVCLQGRNCSALHW